MRGEDLKFIHEFEVVDGFVTTVGECCWWRGVGLGRKNRMVVRGNNA